MIPFSPDLFWLVVISFIVAFVLSFGIGANDVANSFGTSVGARVLSLKAACILATVFEIAGAVLIGENFRNFDWSKYPKSESDWLKNNSEFFFAGYKVSDTLRKVLIDVNMYQDAEEELIYGYLSSLGEYKRPKKGHLR